MSAALTPLDKIRFLSSRVISILGCNPSPFTLLGTNSYLVGSGKERILIDTGSPNVPEYIELLSKVLAETNSVITKIILTHYHNDHIGGLADVRKLCNRNIPAYKFDFSSDKERSEHGCYDSQIDFIKDKHELKVEDATLTAHYNPGHCDDHMVLWLKEERALFSADSVLGEGTAVFTNLSHYTRSLYNIKNMKADVIYPGHGPVVKNVDEHVGYYISHRQERENQVVDLLELNNNSASSIVEVLYKDYPSTVHNAAGWVILLHLHKLHDDGKVMAAGDMLSQSTVWQLRPEARL